MVRANCEYARFLTIEYVDPIGNDTEASHTRPRTNYRYIPTLPRDTSRDTSEVHLAKLDMNPTTVDGLRQWIRATLGSARIGTDELARRAVAAKVLSKKGAGDVLESIIETMEDLTPMGPLIARDQFAVRDLLFLHQVTETEAASGVVDMVLDGVVAPYVGDNEHGVDPDTEVIMVSPPGVAWETADFGDDILVGPDGWLSDQAGNWIGLRQVEGGWAVEFLGTDPPDPDPVFLATLREWFTERKTNTRTEPAVLVDVLFEQITQVESTVTAPCRVVPSIALLVEVSGCTVEDGWIGGPGTDWDVVHEEVSARTLAYLWRTTESAVKGAATLQSLALLFESSAGASGRDISAHITAKDRSELIALLTDPEVFRLVRDQYLYPLTHWELTDDGLGTRPDDVEEIDDEDSGIWQAWHRLVAALRPTASGRAAAHLDLIAAHLTKDPLAKIALLESANRIDRRNLDALDYGVWMAAVNAESAVARNRLDDVLQEWVKAGGMSQGVVDGWEEATPIQVLRLATSVVGRRSARHSGPQVGRNEPCPCGSGRKYKQCHLGKELDGPEGDASAQPLVGWIQAVMLVWWSRVRRRRFVDIERLLDRIPAGDQRNILMTFVVDGDLMNPAVIARFLSDVENDRGRPLPPALARVVREWSQQPMRLCEVLDRAVGVQLTLRDLVTGDLLVIEAPEVSKHYNIGDLLFTRVVSNGPALQNAFGVLPIAWRNRDAVLAFLDEHEQFPDAEAIASLVIGRVGVAGVVGPGESRFRNTDGDDMVFVDATVTVVDTKLSTNIIRQRFDDFEHVQDSGDDQWSIVRADDAGRTHRGMVELLDTKLARLRISTNSIGRFDAAIAMLAELLGELRVDRVLRDTADDVRLARDLGLSGADPSAEPSAGVNPDDLPPDVLEQIREQMTQRWLSEKVPALGGLTPAEAANDPTRRQDLIRLLESFRTPPVLPAGMPNLAVNLAPDPDELAARLGVRLG